MKTVTIVKSGTVRANRGESLLLKDAYSILNDSHEEIRWSDQPITKTNNGWPLGRKQQVQFRGVNDIYIKQETKFDVVITTTNRSF